MPRTSDAKGRLLQTASDLLAESSYGSVGVEQICERAGVQKGSFYHFFPSKSDLAVAAIDNHWEKSRPEKDRVFSPQVPPLERLTGWCALITRNQTTNQQRTGKVLGCPYSSIGSELSTQDEAIRHKCQEISSRTCRYVESALRDAQTLGMIPVEEPAAKSRELYSFVMGVILQAKIENDLGMLDRLAPGIFRLLGVKEPVAR